MSEPKIRMVPRRIGGPVAQCTACENYWPSEHSPNCPNIGATLPPLPTLEMQILFPWPAVHAALAGDRTALEQSCTKQGLRENLAALGITEDRFWATITSRPTEQGMVVHSTLSMVSPAPKTVATTLDNSIEPLL